MAHLNFIALFACSLVCFVLLFGQSAEAAIAHVNFSNPDFPGKCVFSHNHIMSPGETGKSPMHQCTGVTCHANGHVEFRTCAAVAPPKGCKQRDFVNPNRSYPECCERSYDCTKQI